MANKHSKDYIPTAGDIIAEREAREEWSKTHADPRHCYDVTYVVNGNTLSGQILAMSENDAIADLKQQCGMVGWFPRDINIKRNYEEEK